MGEERGENWVRLVRKERDERRARRVEEEESGCVAAVF